MQAHEQGGGAEGQVDPSLSGELHTGIHPRTLRSSPEPKSDI